MLKRFKDSSLMFWSLEILIVVGIIFICSKISFVFSPIAIFISTVFIPILVAGILFYILNPIVNLLTKIKLGKFKIGRTLAVTIVFLLLAGLITLSVIFFVPRLTDQIVALVDHLPKFMDSIQDLYGRVFKQVNSQQIIKKTDLMKITDKMSSNITNSANDILNGISNGLGGLISATANAVIILVTVPVVLFYMLKDGNKLGNNIRKLLPKGSQNQVMDLLNKMSDTLSKYIGGQVIECLFVGTFTAIGYFIIGMPYALLLGVIAGICNIIPYLGPYIGIAPALAISLTTGNLMNTVYNIIVVVIVQQIDGNLVYPNVIGKTLQIHPLTIIIILLAAGNIAGIMGMILAVPLYAIVKVIVSYLYNIYQLRN
ncbi:AI-2E family transporter [Lentilactobacillus laojiaonis]|uniref:AI-2E family transporter n=1 Tax=Lentilactobacillus laojiaonis TaxID=2883998 RepID=UPI001D0BC567|nr:AI-2E family transporter [Lentilactobacillus laojiaonis]UDM32439.1 AI-2E family transporter [Lentilactobacillus laojiaonis]